MIKKIRNLDQNDRVQQTLQELETELYNLDFSETSNKNEVMKKVFSQIEREEVIKMKKKISIKKMVTVAAATLSLTLFMQTAVAKEIVDKIIQVISLNHIEFIQTQEREFVDISVPQVLKGKLFTKEGKEIQVLTADIQELYTAEGEKIRNFDMTTGEIITEKEAKKARDESMMIETDTSKISDYTCFTVKLPSYLPEGYTFDRAEYYKDENGKVENSKYVDLYFMNETTGQELFMQERFADEETAYQIGTDGAIEEIQVNGNKAVLLDGRNIDWESEGVLFGFSGQGNISKEELIKIASSIK